MGQHSSRRFDKREQHQRKGSASLNPKERGLQQDILSLLVGAVQQLSLNDISTAVALSISRGQLKRGNVMLNPEKQILRVCWPLVEVSNSVVRLCHMSVKDYLLSAQSTSGYQDTTLRLTVAEVNDHLARVTFLKLC